MAERARIARPVLAVCLAILTALAALWPAAGRAKVVGIVFDDSGSMQNYVNLPAFGAQLLGSTLNAGSGGDRLFTALLNDSGPREQPLRTADDLQRFANGVRSRWTARDLQTPVRNVFSVLEQVIEAQKPGEQAFFFVISDGAFNAIDPAQVEARLTALAARAKGPVRVDFLLILPGGDRQKERQIDAQNVRPGLARIFNGDRGEGARTVTDFPSLVTALRDIIARVSGTEYAGDAGVVRAVGDRIEFTSPFSISRVISVATGASPAGAPAITATSFAPTVTARISSAMARADTQPGWGGRPLEGETTQFVFQPALAPGDHSVTFDRRIGDDAFLLFATEATLELTVVDAAGTPVPRAPDGAYLIASDADPGAYRLAAAVFDEAGGAQVATPLADIDAAGAFTARLARPGGVTNLALARDPAANRAVVELPPLSPGEYGASGSLRLPGFVSPVSPLIAIRAEDRALALSLTLSARSTDATGAPEVVIAPGPETAIADLRVSALSEGRATVALETSDDDIYLGDATGAPIPDGAVVTLGPGRDFEAVIWARGGRDGLGATPPSLDIAVTARAVAPLTGEAQASLVFSQRYAELRLIATGHAGDPTGAAPFQLTGADLSANDDVGEGALRPFAFDYYAEGAVRALAPSDFEVVAPGGPWLDWTVQVSGASISVAPETSWWCWCGLYFTGAEGAIDLVYAPSDGIQPAAERGGQRIAVGISDREAITSCGWITALTLLAIYLLIAILKWIAARRFPRKAVLRIEERRSDFPRKLRLRGGGFPIFARAMFWPIFGTPHEVFRAEGLALRARAGGGDLLLADCDQQLVIDERGGDSIMDLRSEDPKLLIHKARWWEQFYRRDGSGIEMTLLADVNEA